MMLRRNLFSLTRRLPQRCADRSACFFEPPRTDASRRHHSLKSWMARTR